LRLVLGHQRFEQRQIFLAQGSRACFDSTPCRSALKRANS
jgi:hypothetical protein